MAFATGTIVMVCAGDDIVVVVVVLVVAAEGCVAFLTGWRMSRRSRTTSTITKVTVRMVKNTGRKRDRRKG